MNVDASSHVTRVQNTLRTEIESWKDVESLVDEIGHKELSNLYNNFLNLSHVMGPSPARAGLKRQFCKGAAVKLIQTDDQIGVEPIRRKSSKSRWSIRV